MHFFKLFLIEISILVIYIYIVMIKKYTLKSFFGTKNENQCKIRSPVISIDTS